MKKFQSKLVKILAAATIAVSAGSVAVEATSTNTTYAASLSKSEKAAKRWIAMRESGGSYTARNGNCYGRYQLLITYLHGDLSPKNQERVADNYAYSRYGSWANAKRFWLAHHWY